MRNLKILRIILINLSITSISIYICLLLFSLFDFYKPNSPRRIKLERIFNEDIPERLNLIDKGYIPSFSPFQQLKKNKNSLIYPIGSLPLTDSYLCNEGYGTITYKTDRFGLRNSDIKWNKIFKSKNIFLIGDSFIHGCCVPEDALISEIVQKNLNINTINIAMGSNGSYEYIAALKSVIKPIIEKSKKENFVLINFFSNDDVTFNSYNEKLLKELKPIIEVSKSDSIGPTNFYKKNLIKQINKDFPQSIDEMKRAVLVTFRGSRFSVKYQLLTLDLKIRSNIKTLIKKNFRNEFFNSDKQKNNISITEKSILLLSEICNQKCNPMVAYIPPSNIWTPSPFNNSYKKRLKDYAEKYNIPFVDGQAKINPYEKGNYAPKGGHLSIEGYKKYGDLISERIRDKFKN